MLLSDYRKYMLLPEKELADFRRPAPSIPASIGHHQEWIEACKAGVPTSCHFGYLGLLTEANYLGNVAFGVGHKMEWDAEKIRIPNAARAGPYLRRDYRSGWTLT